MLLPQPRLLPPAQKPRACSTSCAAPPSQRRGWRAGGGRRVLAAPAAAAGPSSLDAVLQKLDELNSQDPRSVVVDGAAVPYELAYARWLTGWVRKLTEDGNPPLTDELIIAARGQHVQRWTSPRGSYPDGKAAYLQWREDLKQMHARVTGEVMRSAGYDDAAVAKVESLIKKKLMKEPEGQVLEDALCLVFLERQLSEFRLKETPEKMVDILRKTWTRKMGPKGRAAALGLQLGPEESALITEALGA